MFKELKIKFPILDYEEETAHILFLLSNVKCKKLIFTIFYLFLFNKDGAIGANGALVRSHAKVFNNAIVNV